MNTIDPNALYSAAELRELVGETLFDRIKHIALCRDRYFGKHVLEALDSLAKSVSGAAHEPARVSVATPGRKGGAKREETRTRRISFDQVKPS